MRSEPLDPRREVIPSGGAAEPGQRKLLEKLLEFSGNLVFVLDPEGRFLQVNEGFSRTTGYARDDCLGSSIFDRIVTADFEVEARAVLDRVLQQGAVIDYEMPLRTRCGELRVIRWTMDVLETDHGLIIAASGIDLTDLWNEETQRLELEWKLAEMQKLEKLGRLAATIAHEFNNVLMGIQPYGEIVERLAGDHQQLQISAHQIVKAVKRGTRITNEILRFTRPAKPIKERVRVMEWLEEIVSDSRIFLGNRVEVTIDGDDDLEVLVDPSQLDQVIINLLVNARDAMEGSGKIELNVSIAAEGIRNRFAVISDPQRYVHLEVRDDGPGISEEVCERLFEPFFTTKQKGVGLGLAVCHQIVRAHQGHLFVESVPGEGARFHLLLRRADAIPN